MTAERWNEVKSILAAVLDEPDTHERLNIIEQRCHGDDALQHEVTALLEQSTTNIDSFVAKAATPLRRELSTLAAGDKVGTYRILRELGRGGMGAVYLAERADGAFEQQVAIKVLKRGTDTDEVLRRFYAERQILARLIHPNIARLLDAGTTDSGLPYFVMEYVAGKPLIHYATDKELPLRDRLNLFRRVCGAVSYAHQNLVVHRDLKPSNVLVTDAAELKLLDFGIAKLLDDETPEVTSTVQRRLTPIYASPEQVKGDPVTTVSDVYSLGVILFELLTGERPCHFKTTSNTELARAICEQEPQRPSTVVAPASMVTAKALRGDIDNIVLKALRKDPARRYQSVDQLSEDLRRYLAGLPVRARRDTVSYRTIKFVQRHKLGVGIAAAVSALLLNTTAVAVWQSHQARDEKRLADERFEEVRQLAHSILFDYHDQIATLPGSTKVREQLVRDSLKYLDTLARQATDHPGLQRELAAAYLKVGDVQGRPYFANLGSPSGAAESYTKALAIWQRLHDRSTDLEIERNIGIAFARLGEVEQGIGNPTAALGHLRAGIDVYERLARTSAVCSDCEAELARMYGAVALVYGSSATASIGDSGQALAYHSKALAIYERLLTHDPQNLLFRQRVPVEQCYIAQLFSDGGDQPRALDYYLKALDAHKALAVAEPANTYVQRELAVNYSNVCGVRMLLGDSKSLSDCNSALAIFQLLASNDPHDANIGRDLAIIERKSGEALALYGGRAGAEESFARALEAFEELAKEHPDDTYLRHHRAVAYLRRSECRLRWNDAQGSFSDASAAIHIAQNIGKQDASNVLSAKDLATAFADAGAAARQLGKADDAIRYANMSYAVWQTLEARNALTAPEKTKLAQLRSQGAGK